MTHQISAEHLTIQKIAEIIEGHHTLKLSADAVKRITHCREYLDKKIAESEKPIYGVTTGFGSLCKISISNDQLSQLQINLMMSHACGVGERVPNDIVKIMILLKVQSLSYGYSGVKLDTVERLIDLFNNDVYPVVYKQGSVGASGDLVPLAHLCLPIVGLGEVEYKGERMSGAELCKKMGWEPVKLGSKEGLALLNGTQNMSAHAVWALIKAERLSKWADVIAAVSLEAYDGRIEPFNLNVHLVRPHAGQLITAAHFQELLQGSELIQRHKEHVQDPYSFRCIPQVHGATKDSIQHVLDVVETEINSVTDNPTVFPDEDIVVSAGNFHGQPLALVLDFLSIAMAELGNISERRIYQLISGKRELPSFLVKNPGLNSGFMIPQYAAASIVNQNKAFTMPCSTDSIESSQGQEDHVSMGANAATKCYLVVNNVEKILGIELFNAAQALEFRRPLKSSPFIEEFVKAYRTFVPFVENDTYMHELIQKSIEFVNGVRVE